MKTQQYVKTGHFHQLGGQKCQDRILVRETDGFLFAAMADGASACRHSEIGAEAACRGAIDFFQRERKNVFDYPAEKISYLLSEHILYFLEMEADKCGQAICGYASTFLAAFSETDTGRTILVNLGDGCIARMEPNGFHNLLPPKQYHGSPCLTTTEGAYRAMDVRQITLSMNDTLCLCTDGFLHFLQAAPDRNIVFYRSLINRDLTPVELALEAAEEADDSSYLAIWRS